jgi:hypothetical protein
MKATPIDRHKIINYSRPLFAAGLIASSLVYSIAPVLSAPMPSIDNQATATYEDPSNPPTTTDINDPRRINTVSNLIRITIAEVAGITVKQTGITNDKDVNISTVVKSGDTVYFRFDITNIGNDGTKIFVPNKAGLTGAGTVQRLQYLDDANVWKDIADAGLISANILRDKVLKIRVPVKVKDGASGDLSVSLGKTPVVVDSQNIEIVSADLNTLKGSDRVFTIDNDDTADGEISGAPGNGTREAMDTQTITIGKQPQAFATIKESDGTYVVADRSITYNLSVKVENIAPKGAGDVVPADLVGVTVPGLKEPGILISDAIPVGTKFASAIVPNGWILVYQYGTAIGPTDRADTSTWSTTPPEAKPNDTLRRVGFILTDGRIPKGVTVDGFQLKLTVINPFATTQVLNIAQLFGNSPANPNDPTDKTPNTNLPVVDESGDLNPNDFNADGTPGPKDSITGKPVVNPGIGDPSTVIGKFIVTPINPGTIVNGPNGSPDAKGLENDNNRDFTNKSIITPVEAGSKFDPAIIGFTNTVKNLTGVPLDIKIIPTIKADENLPDGTIVTLRYPNPKDPKKVIAQVVFTVKGGKFVADDATKPTLVIPQVASQESADYITGIDLPKGTDALKGYSVELVAFIDRNNDNLVGTDELTNKTTDRAYTGFISVVKESRVLGTDNKTVITDFSGEKKSKLAKPGQYIEYRLTFTNISPKVPDGSGSKGLSATKFTIIENGYASPNNWAGLTENDPNSATVSVGTLNFSLSNGTSTTTVDRKVTKYTHSVGNLAPQDTGTFTFRRQVSK